MKKIIILIICVLIGYDFLFAQVITEFEGAITIDESTDTTPDAGTIQWNGTDFLGWTGNRWVSLTNFSTAGTVTDIAGIVYQTGRFGDQEWMLEDLTVKLYNDNTVIEEVVDNATWQGLTTGARCRDYFVTSSKFLYNWHAVNTGKLCPTGWHVPTDAEWTTLIDYLGGPDIAGGKMKEVGTANWRYPNAGATNESGFLALPSATRNSTGTFSTTHTHFSKWWSSTESSNGHSWNRALNYLDSVINKNSAWKRAGFPIRCIRD